MSRPSPTLVRIAFLLVLLVSGGAVAGSYLAFEPSTAGAAAATTPTDPRESNTSPTESTASRNATEATNTTAVPLQERLNGTNVTGTHDASGNLTVVATQGFYVSDERAELVAFDEDGEVVYYDDTYRVYFDVDPVPGRPATVEYVAAKHLSGEACADFDGDRCTRNVVNRVNLTTGRETRVYGKVTPRIYSARWHDVDRLNDTHLVVADIVRDGVFIVDTRTNRTTWRWNASTIYTEDMGGKEGDWTHVNDVEPLDDGRIMVSMRNMDQVVFLRPGAGVNESWSLGRDDAHDVLYEQHNPDYLPADRGGPGVVVADSENGRVVEYERTNGTWQRTWGWTDSRLQWPRDADRLPNGNTLVVDSHGDRVVEVTPSGEVTWNVTIGMPYDAERLGTGDESAGGETISKIRERRQEDADTGVGGLGDFVRTGDSDVVTHPDRGPVETFWAGLKGVLPPIVVNGLLYVSPPWVRFTDLVFGFVFLLGGVSWGGAELYWSDWRLRRLPATLRRRLR